MGFGTGPKVDYGAMEKARTEETARLAAEAETAKLKTQQTELANKHAIAQKESEEKQKRDQLRKTSLLDDEEEDKKEKASQLLY